jgi:hypothetical protein
MPSPVTNPLRPQVRALFYNSGQGDPIVTDRGIRWYDLLQQTWQYGTFNRNANGYANLEFLEGIGLVCRPFLTLRDAGTLLSWTVSGGTWETRWPQSGFNPVRRVCQLDLTSGTTWAISENAQMPENPHFAFSLIIPPVASGWSAASPFVRTEWGNFGVEYRSGQGWALMKKFNGGWVAVRQLPDPISSAGTVKDEALFIVRYIRGGLGISVDFGKTYTWWFEPNGAPVYTPPSNFTCRGQGSQVFVGRHTITYNTGTFTSFARNTLTSRAPLSALFTGSRYDMPYGTGVSISDVSNTLANTAQWGGTLTASQRSGATTFWDTPVLYAVLFRYPVVATTPTLATTEPFHNKVTYLEVDKPFRLAESTCSMHVMQPHGTGITNLYQYRERKVLIQVGLTALDNSITWSTLFTGYVTRVDADITDKYGRTVIRFTLDNFSCIFKKARWDMFDTMPLGGFGNVSDISDFVLATEGFGTAYRNWSPNSLLYPIPAGIPEQPVEMIKTNEDKWTTLLRVNSYGNLEVGVGDDGTLLSLPFNYIDTPVTQTYTATSATDIRQIVQSISTSIDFSEVATAVLCWGTSNSGEMLLMYAVDTDAEVVPGSLNFCGKRRIIQEEVQGAVTPGLLQMKTQTLAIQNFGTHVDTRVCGFWIDGLQRRNRVVLNGCDAVGIPTGTNLFVLATKTTWDLSPDALVADLKTYATLRMS